MRRFLSGALPFYALAGLAMCMYLVLYKTNLFDLNAIVQDATGSPWFPVFMFACVLLELVFPYFGYFPGTALILMSVALNPKPADVSVFIVAWAAIIVGAVLSYGQARFFRPMLQRVASKAALGRCESPPRLLWSLCARCLVRSSQRLRDVFHGTRTSRPEPDARARSSLRGCSGFRGHSVRRRDQTGVIRRRHR